MKQNVYLIHLDLEQTGLIESAVKTLTSQLRRVQTLSCLHLSGNKLTDELIEWIRERIHAKPAEIPHRIIQKKGVTEKKGKSEDKAGSMFMNILRAKEEKDMLNRKL